MPHLLLSSQQVDQVLVLSVLFTLDIIPRVDMMHEQIRYCKQVNPSVCVLAALLYALDFASAAQEAQVRRAETSVPAARHGAKWGSSAVRGLCWSPYLLFNFVGP